ncbi:hypothetical protein [Tessaracoccus coleopterorum]|uniref:hypothetical protein n=1 Tax=Tessaracoccus coleopterorum TaxID=2714950 RepID=UPI001E378583|nr:hypothetical protein [Tessaracoccus coleopterorum]
MLLASERGADLGESISYEPRSSDGAMETVSDARAAALLLRATESESSFTGMQRVWISDGEGRYRTAEVRTTKVAGDGAKLEVFDARAAASWRASSRRSGRVRSRPRWLELLRVGRPEAVGSAPRTTSPPGRMGAASRAGGSTPRRGCCCGPSATSRRATSRWPSGSNS